jgi:hypothetical protein
MAMAQKATRREAIVGGRSGLTSFDCAKTGRIEKFAVDCSTRLGTFRPEFV